jgi:glycosyltransferase involved in cell wall biosynthesis
MTFNKVKISLCIPTYNRMEYAYSCIKEMQKIKNNDIEIIVSDNNSEDDTVEVIKELAKNDSRIKIFKNDTNIGQAKNIIKVFELAKGDYIYLTSDEDLVNPIFFSKLINLIKIKDYSLILGSIFNQKSKKYYIKEESNYFDNLQEIKQPEHYAYRHYLSGNIFKRKYLNIEKLNIYTDDNRNLYSYIPALLMCIEKGKILTLSDVICFQNIAPIQYTDNALRGSKIHFTDPRSRIEQFEFWTEITNELIKNQQNRHTLLDALGKKAALISFHPVFKSYEKNLINDYRKKMKNNPYLANGYNENYLLCKLKTILKTILIGKK